jgi:hypothetical protein
MSGVGSQAITHLRNIECDKLLIVMSQTYDKIVGVVDLDEAVVRMLLWCNVETRRASIEIWANQPKLASH